MVKAEWGKRHKCINCDAAFYDLNKPEIICPKCETGQKKKRSRAATRAKKEVAVAEVQTPVVGDEVDDEKDTDEEDEVEDDEEAEEL